MTDERPGGPPNPDTAAPGSEAGEEGALAPEPSLAARIAEAGGPGRPAGTGTDSPPSADRLDESGSAVGREPSDVEPGEAAATSSDLGSDRPADPGV